MNTFPALLQAFFAEKLIAERQSSPNTLAAYRDTFVLLLRYMDEVEGRQPEAVSFETCTAETIASFLNYFETERGNSVSTRNARLAAIRSFFHYASFRASAFRTNCRGHVDRHKKGHQSPRGVSES